MSLFHCAWVGGTRLQAGGHLPAAAVECAGPGQSDSRGKGTKNNEIPLNRKTVKTEFHCVNLDIFFPCKYQVTAVNKYDPPMEVVAARDHITQLVYQLMQPQVVYDRSASFTAV